MKYNINDIHSHVVYGVDDGARNLDMSIEMLRNAHMQGVRNIVCTPHSYGDIKQYLKNIKTLQEQIKKENINVNLYSGCEIYCDEGNINRIIVELNLGSIPTINKTKYVLVEFNPYADANEIIKCVRLLREHGYKIIIAHVERYYNLSKEDRWLSLLKEWGCLFQVNAYSVFDERDLQIKMFAQKLLKEKYVTFLGSDAHRTNHRPYMIANGIDYICKNCDEEYARDICYRNAENLLNIEKEID